MVGDPSFARGISDWRSAGWVIEWLGGDRGLPVDRPVSVGSGTSEFEVVPRIGSERLVKNGDGTLILGQASASTGGVVVRAGELVVTNSQSLCTGGLWVRPGATVRFDNGAGDIALTALDVQDIGKVDLGQTRISLPAGAADVASVREAIKAGQKGWGPYQTYGLTTSQTSPSTGSARSKRISATSVPSMAPCSSRTSTPTAKASSTSSSATSSRRPPPTPPSTAGGST